MQTLWENVPNPYDSIPVHYCKHCLSLKIRDLDGNIYCDECGNTDIIEDNIFDWEEKYELKYKHKFISNYGRKHR
jgi:hypothetical protein